MSRVLTHFEGSCVEEYHASTYDAVASFYCTRQEGIFSHYIKNLGRRDRYKCECKPMIEKQWHKSPQSPSPSRTRVLVVGGGPAGLMSGIFARQMPGGGSDEKVYPFDVMVLEQRHHKWMSRDQVLQLDLDSRLLFQHTHVPKAKHSFQETTLLASMTDDLADSAAHIVRNHGTEVNAQGNIRSSSADLPQVRLGNPHVCAPKSSLQSLHARSWLRSTETQQKKERKKNASMHMKNEQTQIVCVVHFP